MSAALPPLPAEDLAHVLAHTGELWRGARGARFFVTGGTGFFGTWLLESFARANDTWQLGMRAVVLTRDPAAYAERMPHLAGRPDLELHRGSLEEFPFPAGAFSHSIHAAADTGIWTRNADGAGLLERIERGTSRLLEFNRAAKVADFLHVSSGAVYGPQSESAARLEDDDEGLQRPLPAGALWAEGKRLAERLCCTHAVDHRYTLKVARCFAFVGPHLTLDGSYAIGNFLRDALLGRTVRVHGDGSPMRSYLYAADLAIWLWTLLFKGPAGRAYNVGSPHAVTIGELARLVATEAGGDLRVEIAGRSAAGPPVAHYVPSVRRAELELGLRVSVGLDEAVRRTLNWHRLAPVAGIA